MPRMRPQQVIDKKKQGEKIVMLTAYDYALAALIDPCGIDIILVGDSLANVVLGLSSTRQVTMAAMLHHCQAANRAVGRAMLVGDMPYESYQKDLASAVANAQRFVQEAGCDAVKIEWFEGCPEVAAAIIGKGIPVMGHVGLTPQAVEDPSGFKAQGRDAGSAVKIYQRAQVLEECGCFSIVLECVPDRLAAKISDHLHIPTIGIGAGPHCDGQVLVTYDLLGLVQGFHPKFVKRYADAGQLITQGVESFRDDVRAGRFPDRQHSYTISDREMAALERLLAKE